MKNRILIYGLFIILGAALGAGGYYYLAGQSCK